MALPPNLRPARLAQDTQDIVQRALRERANNVQRQNATPLGKRPDYNRQNVQAVDYGDSFWNIPLGQNRVVSPANFGRGYFFIVVIGANPARVSLNKPATGATGIPLAGAGGFWEPLVPPAGAVNVFSAAGTDIIVLEG